jgi:ABC-type lipoprotein release transport system permease subunit
MILFKIAWRNIWRNKLRSLIVILATAAGTWSVLLLISFVGGFIEGYINNVISTEIGHIQLHQPKYADDPKLTYSIPHPASILRQINSMPGVHAATYRMTINGMLSSSHGVRGVKIIGIIPENENKVFNYSRMISMGHPIDTNRRAQVMIGQSLAHDLQLDPGKKIVLTFRDTMGNLSSGAFRVSGEFKTSNETFDNGHVYVRYQDLQQMTGLQDAAQEIVIRCDNDQAVPLVTAQLTKRFPKLKVQTYLDLSPEIGLFRTQLQASSYIYVTIFMLALIFGIINTMLMAVLERIRELGVLMAIGLNRIQTFWMIVIETILLATIGTPIGMLLAAITLHLLAKTGMDLSHWSAGLNKFGMNSVIYPIINAGNFWQVAIAVFITAVLASIYPALKAIRLKPVEAIHKI